MSAFIKLGSKEKIALYDNEGILVEPPSGLLEPVDREIPDTDPRAAFAEEPISVRLGALKDELAETYASLHLYKGRSSIDADVAGKIQRVKEIFDNAECEEIDDLRNLFACISKEFAVPEDELPLLKRRRTTRMTYDRKTVIKDKPLPPFKIAAGDTQRDNILYNLILGDGRDDEMDRYYDDFPLKVYDKKIKKKLKGLRPRIKIRKDHKKPQTKAQKLKEDRKATRKFFSVSETCIWKDWHNLPTDEIFQNFHYPTKENKYSEQFPIYFEYDPHYELDNTSEDDKSEITVGPSDIFIDYFSEVEFMYDEDEYNEPYLIQKDKKLSNLYKKIFNSQELTKKKMYDEEIKSDKKPFFTSCVDYYGKYMKYDCLSKSPKHISKKDLDSLEIDELIGEYEDEYEEKLGPELIVDTFNGVMDCHAQHSYYKLVNRNLISTQEYLKLMSLPPHKARQYENELMATARERTTRHSLKCVGCMKRTPKPKYILTKECLGVEGNPRYLAFRDINSTLRWSRHRRGSRKGGSQRYNM